MNYADQMDYNNDPVACVDASQLTNGLFKINTITEEESVFHTIAASTNPALVLHTQQGYGHAQCSNWAQPDWGSAKWVFEDAGAKTPQGLAYKIQNSYTRTESGEAVFLYESDGKVEYGPLTDPTDLSFYWFFTIDDNGNYTIRNWKTGHFITYRNQLDNNEKMLCLDYSDIDSGGNCEVTFRINNINDGGIVRHNIESAVNSQIRIHTEKSDHPVCSNWAQNSFGSAQWIFIDAISEAPSEELTPNGYTRIRNFWTGQYLYEDNGKVRYGQPQSNDRLSHWDIIESDGCSLIRNVATGHYFSYKDQLDYNEPVECLDPEVDGNFKFNIYEEQYQGETVRRIIAATNSNLVLHVEQQTGYAQCSNWAQPTWGSSAWIFEPASDDEVDPVKEELPVDQDPAAQLKDGDIIRIKNSWREMYIYQADDNKVAYGNIPASDLRSQWVVELEQGNIRLKNRGTGQYMSAENGLGYAECADYNDGTLYNLWEISAAPNNYSGLKTIRCAGWNDDEESGEASFYLHTEGDKGYVEYGPIPPTWGSPQWIISRVSEHDPSTGYVRLKNSATGNYLYEKDGKVIFGTAEEISEGEASSHWVIERDIRYTRIRNRATGNYISAEGVLSLVDPLICTPRANNLNSVWKIEPAGEGTFTIENMNKDGWFIHNANAITSVTASCSRIDKLSGAAKWVFEEAPVEIDRELPTDYVLIKTRSQDKYLYENKNGVVLYGDLNNESTAYHWKLVQMGDSFVIQNRYSGKYLSVAGGKPFLQTSDDSSSDNARWLICAASVSNFSIIASKAEPDKFVNINSGLGFAQCSVSSNEKTTAQWSFETPSQSAQDPVYTGDKTDTSTPAMSHNQYIAIRNKGTSKYLRDSGTSVELAEAADSFNSQWILEYYNGYRRIRNKATGNYLKLAGADGSLQVSENPDGPETQWIIEDFLGYRKIANVQSGGRYLYTEGESVQARAADNADDMLWSFEPIASDMVYQAKNAFLGGNVVAVGGFATGFGKAGDRVVFTVNVSEAGQYNVVLSYKNPSFADRDISIFVNGVKFTDLTLTSTKDEEIGRISVPIPLNKGINTVSFKYMKNLPGSIAIDSITVENSVNISYKGATLPFVTYEAEDARTNGEILGPSIEYYTFASEASGRKAVKLTGAEDYIEFELAADANAFVIRYVVPDAPGGGGTTQTVGVYADGEKIADVELSSRHSWVYGSYPWSNDPSEGRPHRNFEEIRFMTEGVIRAGSKLRIQKNNQTEYCVIDLVDAEKADAPYEMPENFLSLTDFGAIPDDGMFFFFKQKTAYEMEL